MIEEKNPEQKLGLDSVDVLGHSECFLRWKLLCSSDHYLEIRG